MSRIKILTDSTSDLPQHLIDQYDITVLPMGVNFGDEGYLDGVDITTSEFYAKLKEFDGFPSTSQVSPGAFATAFKELSKEADVIIAIVLSSKLSGTFNSAKIAGQMVEDEVKVICYDSKSASLGEGFLVLEAAKAAQEGLCPEEILQRLDKVKETRSVYFAVPNLVQLEKGGRIGKASAIIGGLLNIIPLLRIEDGALVVKEKIRGKKRIIKRFEELLKDGIEEFGGSENLVLSVVHTDNLEGAHQLVERIESTFGFNDILISEIGPTIGTHTGAGLIAIVFYKKIS